MKRYTLIDNKTGVITYYTSFQWHIAWKLVFIFGIMTGIILINL